MNFIRKNQKKMLVSIGIIVVLGLVYYFVIDVLFSFMKNESMMREAAERYVEVRPSDFQKDLTTVSLRELYDADWLEESLYIPHTTNLCNIENSWVKVEKQDNEYKYHVYLECGDLKSNIDHQGPSITLNGDSDITIDKGSSYEELGVKSVVDNVDGNMDIKEVTITGEVNTDEIGIYEVRYRVKDSLNNETVVTRNVKVAEFLSSLIEIETNGSNYYQGYVGNNYVQFSGNLYQIISLEDEYIKMISTDPISYVDYTSDSATFADSELKNWLNDYYYNQLDENSKKYLVESKYCTDKINVENNSTTECTTYSDEEYKVGLLSVDEFNKSIVNNEETYLQNRTMTWLINFTSDNLALFNDEVFNSVFGTNFMTDTNDRLMAVKPVITIKRNVYTVDGDGTIYDPYKLDDYEYAKSGESLNTRLVGEYIEYSNYKFRIKDINANGTINIITDSIIAVDGNDIMINYNNGDNAKIYNPEENGNIGYIIKNDTDNYLEIDDLVKTNYKVTTYQNNASYTNGETKEYETMFIAPSMFEMYSASKGGETYWLRETSKVDLIKYTVANAGDIYDIELPNDYEAGIKVETTLNKNVKIVEGKGTFNSPYEIR